MARQPYRLPSRTLATRQRSHGQSVFDPCADVRIADYKRNAILDTLKPFSSAALTFSRVRRTERLMPLCESSRRPWRNSLLYSAAGSALLCFIAGGPPFQLPKTVHMTRPITRCSQVPLVNAQRMWAFVDPDSGQQPTPARHASIRNRFRARRDSRDN
jgi:hypothetical protein